MANQPGDTPMDETERERQDGDGWRIVGEYDTYEQAVAAALKDSMSEESAYGTTTYTDCGHYDIWVEVGPDDADEGDER